MLVFTKLNKIIERRDVEFIRLNKEKLHEMSWDYLSLYFKFTFNELREFKDYIIWGTFFSTFEVRDRYNPNQLKEFFKYLSKDMIIWLKEEFKYDI